MSRHLPTLSGQRAAILALLAALMIATRSHLPALLTHLGQVPDASWAVFFIGGFYLRAWARWAFPLLMALAIAVDYAVITGQGTDFWSHYCVSAAYWCLVPAYFALWAGGSLTARLSGQLSENRTLALTALALVGSVALCHLLSQGSFYWISDSVPQPTLTGWWKNYSDWFLPFLRSTAIYVGIGAVVHVIVQQVAHHAHPRNQTVGQG